MSSAIPHGSQKDFWKFYIGQSLSTFGSTFTGFALPLLVYQLTKSPMALALTFAADRLPYLLMGVFAGAYADRSQRKPLMLRTNLLSAALVSSIPALFLLRVLPIWWVLLATFLMSSANILFQAAESAAVPSLVAPERLTEANGRLMAAYTTATFLAPLLAGLIASVLPVVNVLWFDALSFLISAGTLAWIRTSFNTKRAEQQNREVRQQPSMRQDIIEGFRYIWSTPVLRSVVLLLALVNIVIPIVPAELVLFAQRQLSATPFQYGVLLAAGSAGMVLLSLLAKRIAALVPFGRLALVTLATGSASVVLLAISHALWLACLFWGLRCGLLVIFDINIISLRQTIIPRQLLGRVTTTSRVIGSSLTPLGVLVGGLLVARLQVAPVYIISGLAGVCICLGFLLFSPLGLGSQPEEQQVEALPYPQ